MSRLYDTIEPSVVDDEMLRTAVHEQGPKGEAGRIAKKEGIDFGTVTELRLDYRNILKIDNLWAFGCLVKLQLDNNIIESIEGLDHLVHLRWLDLSFNNIGRIQGLSRLTKLEDLTLYSNRIETLENMDSLTNLHVLSVGNNKLGDLDNLLYLRRFRRLQSLNIKGNPVCDNRDFRDFVLAFVPQLDFLNYKLIDAALRSAAKERYELKINEMEDNERREERLSNERAVKDEELKMHKLAFVENLNGTALFDSLYQEDTEGQKLNKMPGVDEKLQQFRDKFVEVCKQLFDFGLGDHQKRDEEVKQFLECIDEAEQANKRMGEDRIAEFMTYRRDTVDELMQMTDSKLAESRLKDYDEEVNKLWDDLMGYELQLVDQLEEAIKEFDRNLEELVGTFIENVQTLMSNCRELENNHNELMMETATVFLEKVMKNELEEEPPDELRDLFVEKDTVVAAVQTSHDLHLLKIDNKEDDIVKRIKDWKKDLMDTLNTEREIKRNRSRVLEINNLVDHLREDMQNLDIPAM